jgi:antitoxin ParD1/3/4
MTSMNISLPDELKEFVDQQLQAGYSSASEFVRELIRKAQKEANREKLEALLLGGLDSGSASPLTDEDWRTLREKAEQRWAKRADGQ